MIDEIPNLEFKPGACCTAKACAWVFITFLRSELPSDADRGFIESSNKGLV